MAQKKGVFINTKASRMRLQKYKEEQQKILEIKKRILNGDALSTIMADFNINFSKIKEIKLELEEEKREE